MKILITTYGTRGDVQPYVALAEGLKQAGYHVVLGTSERFRDFVKAHDLTFGHMDDGLLALIDTDEGKKIVETTTNIITAAKHNILLAKRFKPLQIAQMRDTWELAKRVEPDFILYHPKTGASPHIAEKLGVGCALVTPIPLLVPTSEWSFPIFPGLTLGGWYNRLSYRLINTLSTLFLGKYITRFRRDIGLKPLKRFNLLKDGNDRDIPVLHLISEAVLPRPADWPTTASMTGYCFLKEQGGWSPPADLQAFLEAGPPPVYVGFGSMAGRNPQQLTRIIIEALQSAEVRGIIATGWGGMSCGALPDSIFQIEHIPHEWLFPQVAAVVHHGGAGTTAAGLRSGKPAIIVPFFGDQPFWGRRIHQLGAGGKPIPRKKLKVEKLASAIKEVTTDPTIQSKAREVGRKIRQEDGVSQAVATIQTLVAKKR